MSDLNTSMWDVTKLEALCEKELKEPLIVEELSDSEKVYLTGYIPESKETGVDLYVLIKYVSTLESFNTTSYIQVSLPNLVIHSMSEGTLSLIGKSCVKLAKKYADILYDVYGIYAKFNVDKSKYKKLYKYRDVSIYIPETQDIPECHVLVSNSMFDIVAYLTKDGRVLLGYESLAFISRFISCNYSDIMEAYRSKFTEIKWIM